MPAPLKPKRAKNLPEAVVRVAIVIYTGAFFGVPTLVELDLIWRLGFFAAAVLIGAPLFARAIVGVIAERTPGILGADPEADHWPFVRPR